MIIQAVSPLFGTGAGAGAASAAAGAASAAGTASVAAGSSAGLSCARIGALSANDPHRAININSFFMWSPLGLQRFGADFAGADADRLLERKHEDLAVADLAGVGRFLDRLDHLLQQVVLDRHLDLDLGQEVDDVLRAPVQLGVAFLPAEALDLGDGDALHADGGQRLPHLVKLERLDDCGYEFHGYVLGFRG